MKNEVLLNNNQDKKYGVQFENYRQKNDFNCKKDSNSLVNQRSTYYMKTEHNEKSNENVNDFSSKENLNLNNFEIKNGNSSKIFVQTDQIFLYDTEAEKLEDKKLLNKGKEVYLKEKIRDVGYKLKKLRLYDKKCSENTFIKNKYKDLFNEF